MTQPRCSDEQFKQLFADGFSVNEIARQLDCDLRWVYRRRRRIEEREGIILNTPRTPSQFTYNHADWNIQDGMIFIGSDAHVWPDDHSPAFLIFLQMIDHFRPTHICLNGDVFDGARNSRHPRIMWDQMPTVQEELTAVIDWCGMLEDAAVGAKLIRTIGNHDQRFESYLSANAPAYEGVPGFRLIDHLPRWEEVMSIAVNDQLMIKHRWHNGQHAAFNNVLKSGWSFCTGHTHVLEARAFTDYNGTRYGIQTGTLADPAHPKFAYTEATPKNWQPGFVVLTFKDGKMKRPELVEVIDGEADFHGKTFRI